MVHGPGDDGGRRRLTAGHRPDGDDEPDAPGEWPTEPDGRQLPWILSALSVVAVGLALRIAHLVTVGGEVDEVGLARQLVALAAAAAGTFLLIVLAHHVLGRRAGLLAGLLVALDPLLVAADGSATPEGLALPFVVGAVLCTHWILADGIRATRAVLLGGFLGAAVAVRQELVVLVPLLVAALLAWGPADRRRRLVAAAIAVVVTACFAVPSWAWAVEPAGTSVASVWAPGLPFAPETRPWHQAARVVAALLAAVGTLGLAGLVRRHDRRWLVLLTPPAAVVLVVALGRADPATAAVAHPMLALGVAWLAERHIGRRHLATFPEWAARTFGPDRPT
jgi:4-amino-4-deoxy-L-arabinose transferase-like glycosyltransferase